MIEVRAVKGPTGRLLVELLREKGLEVNTGGKATAVVSYGVPVKSSLPTLNSNAGRYNKLEELEVLHKAGVSAIPVSRTRPTSGQYMGRRLKHTKGKDIQINGAGDYYTTYVPQRREFRVFTFRGRAIASYEKVRSYKRQRKGSDFRKVWNWRNGYAFLFHRDASEELKSLAVAATRALGLDFGAVDIVQGTDNRLYVLEVNTAPGVQDRRQGITALANKIHRWVSNGFKKRKGEVEKNTV